MDIENEQQINPEPQGSETDERDPAGLTEPRGNGDLERDSLEKGEEKLDRIVGN